MTFVSGKIACQTFGGSTVSSCTYDAANNRVLVDAVLASDLGVSSANASTAPNRLVISFEAQYITSPIPVTNIAQACWDPANNSTAVSICTNAVSAQAHYAPSTPVEPIPVDSRWMLWLMALLLIGAERISARRGR
jgi:hypothetical protein